MTLAQHLRQEGIQEGIKTGELKGRHAGRQEGRREGLHEGTLVASRQSVLEALDLRFDTIPDGLRDSLNAIADPEKLRTLLRAAIVSDSLESFAASL
jgi:predicted transposase YdaD